MKDFLRAPYILLVAIALCWPPAADAAEPLGSSEQFKIDQVHRSLDNVDKDLERIESADREAAADLARKGAERNLDQARERLDQFLSRNPDLRSHPDIESAGARLNRLASAIAQARSSPPAASPSAPAQAAAGSTASAATASNPPAATSPAAQAAPAAPAAPAADAGLTRRQKFEIQQIETALNNAENGLEAYRGAERDDMAALALKSAKRGRDDAADKLAVFVDANPDAAGADAVVAVQNRLDALVIAIDDAQSAAAAAADVAASAGADATADATRILELRSEHGDPISAIHGRSLVYYDNVDAVREALTTIESAEQAADAIRPVLLSFRERYGADNQAVIDALDAAGADADSSNSRVAYNASELHTFLEKLDGTRTVSAETVADHVAGRLADIDDYSARIQQQRLAEALEMVSVGQRIDPNNPRLNRLRGDIAQLAHAKREEQLARVDAAEWPGHVSNFPGPGDIEELAEAVHEYLANDRDWGQSEKRPQEVLAVSVAGPWQVAAKDLFGQPIQWRLPVMVAITDDELRPDGIVQAFEVSMVAKEGAPNQAPKSPPWDGFWVGDNYYLRMGELP